MCSICWVVHACYTQSGTDRMVKVPNSRKLAETFASSAMGCCVDVALRRKLFDFRRCPKSETRIQIRGRTGRPPKVPMLHHDTSIWFYIHHCTSVAWVLCKSVPSWTKQSNSSPENGPRRACQFRAAVSNVAVFCAVTCETGALLLDSMAWAADGWFDHWTHL